MEVKIKKNIFPSKYDIDTSIYSEEIINKFYSDLNILETKILDRNIDFFKSYNDIDLDNIYIYQDYNKKIDYNNIIDIIIHKNVYLYNIEIPKSLINIENFNSIIKSEDFYKLTDILIKSILDNNELLTNIKKNIYLKFLKGKLNNNDTLLFKDNEIINRYLYLCIDNSENIIIPLGDCQITYTENTDLFIIDVKEGRLKLNFNSKYVHKNDKKLLYSHYKDTFVNLNSLKNNYELEDLFYFDYEEYLKFLKEDSIKNKNILNKDNIIKLLESYYPGEYSINSDKSEYDEITIRFKDFNITNSKNEIHNIKDFFLMFKIKKDYKKFNDSNLYGARSSFSLEEYENDYYHSHRSSGNIGGFECMCLGNTILSQFMMLFLEKIESEIFESFLIQLDGYVRWESLEGVPYKYIANIKLKDNSNNYRKYIELILESFDYISPYKYILNKNSNSINIREVSDYNINKIILDDSYELEKMLAQYYLVSYFSNIIKPNDILDPNILNVFKIKNNITGEYLSLLPETIINKNDSYKRESDLIIKYNKKQTNIKFNNEYVKYNIIKKYTLIDTNNKENNLLEILNKNKNNLVIDNNIYKKFIFLIENKLNDNFKNMYIDKLKIKLNYDNNLK